MADPTPYDILQDNQISALQEIVTPYYTEHDGPEYSFPIVGQGISASQYRQTNLGTGNGILHRFPETYYLDTHATAAETNQRNSLILKVTRHNEPGAVAESIINGYFHRMTEDIEIPMPPVISPTDVYVTITYDPREEESETGPISVQTHNGSLPTTHGREHIIIAKPRMRPNQLLSNTPLDRQRQYSSPVVYVPNHTTVPNSSDFLYGTTLIMGTQGRGRIYHNSSTAEGWVDLQVGEWQEFGIFGGWSATRNYWRYRNGGVDVIARLNQTSIRDNPNRPFYLPSDLLRLPFRGAPFWSTAQSAQGITLTIEDNGQVRFSHNYEMGGGWLETNFFIPDFYLNN